MKATRLLSTALGGLVALGVTAGTPAIARADTASTAAIAAGAAAIVGALIYDSSNRPYYVRNNHRYYVSQSEANYYRQHHQTVMRKSYVPEHEYPVAHDNTHQNDRSNHDQHHG